MPTNPQKLRVALVHDWLHTYRGGERVLEALCELFPSAEIFTLFYRGSALPKTITQRKIHVSRLNRLPGIERYYRYLLPLFPQVIEQFDFSGYDLILSSSHCVAKGILPPPNATHVCYCHTPMRYVWDRTRDYFGPQPGWIKSTILSYLRQWDVTSSHRVDHFIANSHWVSQRIEKFYRRESKVIHPPVDAAFFQANARPLDAHQRGYYLVVSAFAPYKRVELAIQACEQSKQKLIVVGGGQQKKALQRLAGKHTTFRQVSRADLPKFYSGAKALLFPGEEDFGITPVESMACGTPVIAFGRGGATESVVHGKTGWFFSEQTTEGLRQAMADFENERFSAEACQRRSNHFSKENFRLKFQQLKTDFEDRPNETTSLSADH